MKLSEKIFGTHSSRELKRIMPLVDKIEELRPTMQAMTDEELKDQTRSSRRDWQRERRWMICFRRHSLRCVRLPSVC